MSIDLRSSCVSQWKLTETSGTAIADGQGFTSGVSQRDCSLMTTQGLFGNALRFNGTDDYIVLSNSYATVFSAPFTVSVWVNLNDGQPDTGAGERNDIFGIRQAAGAGAQGFTLYNFGAGTPKVGHMAYYWRGGLKIVSDTGALTNIIPDGPTGWMHLVVTIYTDAGKCKGRLYINNSMTAIEVGSSGDMSGYNAADAPYVGVHNYSVFHYVAGVIENLCIFNRQLTDDEISFLYNNGHGTENLTSSAFIDMRRRRR